MRTDTTTDKLDARKEGQRLVNQWLANLNTARERGRFVAYIFVMGNAIEILRAFDFEMVFPEINSLQSGVRKVSGDFIAKAEDYGFSADVCSYVKADVGLMLSNMQHPSGTTMPEPDLAIASSLCNVYIKWAEIWERRFGTPAFVLDIPGKRFAAWKSPAGSPQHKADSRWVEGQFRDLIARCEGITGKKFDIDRLAEVEENVNEMVRLWIDILAFNQHRPAPYNSMLDGLTYMGVLNAWRGTREGVEYMRLLHDEISGKVARGEGRVANERFRLMFSGTPCYVNMRRMIELFEAHGGVFAASDYLTYAAGGLDSAGLFYDTSRPLESLAEVTTLASQIGLSNHFFSHHQLAQQVKEFAADGLVYHGIKSCRTVATSMADNREYINSRYGIPTLYIESDLIDPRYWSDAQLKNRIDAFFEVLEQLTGGQLR
ncbi:MAG TPA: 2-hydroxyacyl-CoA dehydratase family protein [Ktedonobacteraceae bacterium]|nr:2-hydroxyacyl-CoA dehydratase family protein [Ktedonobacteraceae bacterium]